MIAVRTVLLVVSLVAVGIGCGHAAAQPAEAPEAQPHAPAPVAVKTEVAPEGTRAWAVETLAQLRCDHYKSCDAIGSQGKFDSFDACLNHERARAELQWKGRDCATFDRAHFDACLAAQRADNACDTGSMPITGDMLYSFPGECELDAVCPLPKPATPAPKMVAATVKAKG